MKQTRHLKNLFALAAIFCAAHASNVYASPEDRDGPGGHGPDGGFLQSLDLSSEQRTQLRALRPEREKTRELGQRFRDSRKDLQAMIFESGASDDQVKEKVVEVNKNFSELSSQRVNNLLELRKVLSPAQLRKFGELQKEMWQRRMQEKGFFHHGDKDSAGRKAESEAP